MTREPLIVEVPTALSRIVRMLERDRYPQRMAATTDNQSDIAEPSTSCPPPLLVTHYDVRP